MLVSLPNAFGDAATNMAIDAALLESMPEGLAAFRHYGWTEPAFTFGYSQKFSEVRHTAGEGHVICRRLTGGGIVDHRNDWTYAMVVEASLPAATLAATELYEHLHRGISTALTILEIENTLAPCPRHCEASPEKSVGPEQCFVTPAANDVLRSDERKIAGAALKRNRKGLLVQGSIDRGALPESFDYCRFQDTLMQSISQSLSLEHGQLDDIRPLFKSARIEAEKTRFASWEWTQKR